MRTRTIFTGIAPFAVYRVLTMTPLADGTIEIDLEDDGGLTVRARIDHEIMGDPLSPGDRRRLALTKGCSGGRRIMINQAHPAPTVSRACVGVLRDFATAPGLLLESHAEWARYGPVGDAEVRMRDRAGIMRLKCEDGCLMVDAGLGDVRVTDDVIVVMGGVQAIPETLAAAAAGLPLDEVLRHPTLAGLGIVIESMTSGADGPMTISTRPDPMPVMEALALMKRE